MSPRSRFLSLALFAPTLSIQAPAVVAASLIGGPMVGMTSAEQTGIWLMTDAPARVQIEYWRPEQPLIRALSAAVQTGPDNGHTAQVGLQSLAPATRYAYRVLIDGMPVPDDQGLAFSTQPLAGAPPRDLLIATGSCAYIPDPPDEQGSRPFGSGFEIFDTIAGIQPDLMLWLGDNIYYRDSDLGEDSSARMNARWAATRRFTPLQRLLRTGQHLAIWDDHDYGPDNSDRTFAHKETSIALFKRYWVNGAFGLSDVPGIFSKVSLGDLDLFLLDDRSYRDPDPVVPSPDMTMLGADQLEWLKAELRRSTATFKLIVNGSRMLTERPSATSRGGEGWHNFPQERTAFLDWLEAQRIDGLFFLSGDVHYTHLARRERPGTYPLTELICSPLTSRVHPWPFPVSELPGTWVTERNFCTLKLTGPPEGRVLVVSSWDAAGNCFWREEFPASDLRTPRVPD